MLKRNLKLKRPLILRVFFLISLMLSLWINHSSFAVDKIADEVVTTENQSEIQLLEKGIEYYQQGKLIESIHNWEKVLKKYQKTKQLDKQVIIRTNLAIAYKKIGNLEQQVNQWEQVVNLYRQLDNPMYTGRAMTELAQAYSDSGHLKKAINSLCGAVNENDHKNKYKLTCVKGTALEISRVNKDIQGEIAALGSLGEVYRQLAKYDLAARYLNFAKQKLDIEQSNLYLKSKILNSLGNVYFGKAKLWSLYTESAFKSRSPRYKQLTQEANSYYQNARNNFQNSYQIALEQKDTSAQMRALINSIQLDSYNLKLEEYQQLESENNLLEIKDKNQNHMT